MCLWTWLNTAPSASFNINWKLLTGCKFENKMSFPVFLSRGSTSVSFLVDGKWPNAKEEFSIQEITGRSSSGQAGYNHRCWPWVKGRGRFSWLLDKCADDFTRKLYVLIFFQYSIILNFVLIFYSGANNTKVFSYEMAHGFSSMWQNIVIITFNRLNWLINQQIQWKRHQVSITGAGRWFS